MRNLLPASALPGSAFYRDRRDRWVARVDTSNLFNTACKLAAEARVSAYFHHPGEELVYRGTRGSGTIFFTSCNMRCAFCQNGDISTDKDNGLAVEARTLATSS